MKLGEYLKRERISNIQFATLINVHPQSIRMYIHGTREPSHKIARIITDITNGEVTLEDLKSDKPKHYCPICKSCYFAKNEEEAQTLETIAKAIMQEKNERKQKIVG